MIVDTVLTLIIPSGATRDMNSSDLDNLLQSYALAEKAKDSFIEGEVTFDEYLQLLESHQINVDTYCDAVESNVQILT